MGYSERQEASRWTTGLWMLGILIVGQFVGCDDTQSTREDEMNGGGFSAGSLAGMDETGGSNGGERSGGEVVEGGTGGSEGGSLNNSMVLRIEPRDTILTLHEGGTPPSQSFVLTLVSSEEERVLDPAEASWTVSPSELGVVLQGTFTSSGRAGIGQVFVEYRPEGTEETLIAAANLSVAALQDHIEEGISPEEVLRFDEAPLSESCTPISFIYPEPFTTIPANLQGFTFQWNHGGFGGPYSVTATAGEAQMRWFTTGDQITPEGLSWESIKLSGPNGASQWRVSYLTSAGERCESPALTLFVDRSQLTGAIYYWSTTDAGIMRLAAGDTAPDPFLTPQTAPEISCPACHALSRDGTRIAFTRTIFPPFGDLSTAFTAMPRSLNYDPMGVEGYFPSFSPDPNLLVAGSSGRLVVRDSNSGLEVEALPIPQGLVGGSPDWSWQGERIVAVLGPGGFLNPLPNVGIGSGSIYEWLRENGQWNQPVELVSPMGNTWNTNPAYSPEETFIAFNVNGDNPNTSDEAMGNPNIDLWIKRVGDQIAPVRLDKANKGEMQGNSWPKWSPYDRRGKLWLAFSSTRDYGHQLVQSGRSAPTPQIWVTAIDLSTPPDQDPSSPAFWLPYQSLNSGNHIPYWAPYEKQ